jgi:hypothetical protein
MLLQQIARGNYRGNKKFQIQWGGAAAATLDPPGLELALAEIYGAA